MSVFSDCFLGKHDSEPKPWFANYKWPLTFIHLHWIGGWQTAWFLVIDACEESLTAAACYIKSLFCFSAHHYFCLNDSPSTQSQAALQASDCSKVCLTSIGASLEGNFPSQKESNLLNFTALSYTVRHQKQTVPVQHDCRYVVWEQFHYKKVKCLTNKNLFKKM